MFGALMHAADEEEHHLLADEGREQGEDQLRYAELEEVGEISAPAFYDVAEDVFVVRQGVRELCLVGEEVHDGFVLCMAWRAVYGLEYRSVRSQVALDAVRYVDVGVCCRSAMRETTMRREMSKYAVLLTMGVVVVGGILAGRARVVVAQIPQPPQSPAPSGLPPIAPGIGSAAANDPAAMRMKRARQVAVDDDRHKRMVSDADKLLELATALKAEVDKSTPNETSVTAFNKADQIEKLAHDVKQRLKE